VLGPQPRFFLASCCPQVADKEVVLNYQSKVLRELIETERLPGHVGEEMWQQGVQPKTSFDPPIPSRIHQKSVKNPSNSVRVHQCHGLPGTRKPNVFSVGTYSAQGGGFIYGWAGSPYIAGVDGSCTET
jgi:hypothetical protein